MTKNLILSSCIVWAVAASSNVAPASAIALTNQTGDYAACSADCETMPYYAICEWNFFYTQRIKFIGNPCNGGGCGSQDDQEVHTEFEYPTGRKVTQWFNDCGGTNWYYLDTCAC
jgi:hypothetical protein